jgi:hypothetical protein
MEYNYEHFIDYVQTWLAEHASDTTALQELFDVLSYENPVSDEAQRNRALLKLWIEESTDEEVARVLNMALAMDTVRSRLQEQGDA